MEVRTYGGKTYPITAEIAGDALAIQASMARCMDRFGLYARWLWIGKPGPWPDAGHDFRLNASDNSYPEPDYCPECGREYDE